MDFQCSLQGENFCVSEGEPDVVLTGFMAYLSYVIDQCGQSAQEDPEEDASDEIKRVGHGRSLRETIPTTWERLRPNGFCQTGHRPLSRLPGTFAFKSREGQAASWWQPGLDVSGMRVNRVLRSNHFTSIGSEVALAGAQQPPWTFSY